MSTPAPRDAGGGPAPVVAEGMTPEFRSLCAVLSDGRCLIARGHERDPAVRQTLVKLKATGAVPRELREESVDAEAVAAAWERAPTVTPATGAPAAGGRGVLALGRRLGEILMPHGGPNTDPGAGQLLDRVIRDAAAVRASDIMFRRTPSGGEVHLLVNDRRIRRDYGAGSALIGRAMAQLFHSKDEGSQQSSYQRSSFQGFSVRAGGSVRLPPGVSGLRCERGPDDPDGDHLFARLFYRDQLADGTTLESLGLDERIAGIFAELRMARHGGIFLGGSTGDGKSTTLACNLSLQLAEHNGELNLVTVEDPVEYQIPGAVQIAVPTAGSGEERASHFARALMHFCRVNPGSGMVSEIRDAHAARQVLQFIDTGHQVWTTIHVDNANGIPFRLLDMGVSPAELIKPGNIVLLMRQTILPRLCRSCATDTPTDRELQLWMQRALVPFPNARFRNPEGCAACRDADGDPVAASAWSGYDTRLALAEYIRPDAGYLEFVRREDPQGAWDYWVNALNGRPLSAGIQDLIREGRVDPHDAVGKGARLETGRSLPQVVAGAATA